MILYTIVPIDQVMEGADEPAPDPVEVDWYGVKVLVEPSGVGQGKISRVVSSNPRDFLNPQLQPGTVVSWVEKRPGAGP